MLRPPTGEDEEDPGDEGQDGALGPDVSDVADDERREDEEQGHHGEGRGRADHLCAGVRTSHEDHRNTECHMTQNEMIHVVNHSVL